MMLNVGCGNAKATEKNSTKNNKRKSQEHRREIDYDGNNIEDDYDHEASISENNNSEVVVMSSPFPLAAKRRQFERHKCDPKMMIISNGNGAGVDGDDEEADDEEETRVQQIKTLDSHHLASCPVGGKLASNSLVTSKIGLFERLSYGAGAADSSTARGPAAPVRAPFFSRQPELDDELELHDGRRYVNNARHGDADHHLDDENEEVMFDEDDLDEEYLVLDTIVEEDEEQVSVMADGFSGVEVEGETKATRRQDEISCETGPLFGSNSSSLQQPKKQQQQQATTITQQADCAKCDDDDKLDCDRPAKLTRENNHQQKQQKLQQNATSINNNVHHQHHSSSNDAAFSTNCPRQVLNDEPAASPLVSEGAANKNNAADQRAAIANQSSATSERSVKQQQQQLQQPPAETRTSSLSSSSYSLSPFSPTPPSAAEGEGQNNKSCVEDVDNRKASAVAKQQQQQQVGGVVRADVSSASDVRHEDDDGGEAHRFGDGEPISAQLVSRTASDNMTSCNNNNYKQGPNTNARTSAATDNCDSLSHQAANSTMTSTNTNTTTVTTINTTKTPIADTTSSIINEKAEESRSRAQAAEQRRNIQAQTNKMHYQTLLPSTNRLISEHHARQQQALFRALNERQKILDELGPDERLEQGDLMSSSCVSLNLHHSGSKRQWRKSSARRAGGAEPRSRSSSASVHHQPNGAANNTSDHHHQLPSRHRRRATSKQSRGVPLSSVDLSSITDQQVDEILGQIAPASSSSSLVSSNASLSSGSSSSSSSGSFSSADDFSTSSSCSTDDDYDQNNDNNNATTGQDGLALDSANQKQNNKSQMLRRLRRRLADSEQRSSSSSSSLPAGGHHSTHANGLQQLSGGEPGFAPSVIGVHEDDSVSVNSARRSLRSSARKCREAFKKRGRNGRSDDEEDDNGDRRNQGDLFVSVASASSRGGDQQTSGLGANQGDGGGGRGSDQCSLSPLASHAQTTARCAAVSTAATIGSSSTAEYGAPTSHLLLTSTLRNHQLNTTGVTSSSQHHHHQQQHFDHHSLGSSSIAMSASQSPTTSDELTSLGHHQDHHHHSQPRRPQGGGQSVEAILSRMLGALDEIGAHDEPEQLNDLLERGFLHLEQLLNCSLTSQSSTLPRSQAKALHHQHPLGLGGLTQTPSLVHHPQQLLSQKDSDYGSDTQSNGECFSSSTSQPSQEQMGLASAAASGQAGSASISTGSGDNKRAGETSACSPASPRSPETVPGAASVMDRQHTGGTMPGSSLSPLAIELSFKLAESLRRLAQQQQANRQTQPEAFMATSSADSARESEPITRTVGPTTGSSGGGGDEQAPKARMKSVVMINSGGSTSRPQSAVGSVGGGNMTPVSSRPDEDDESAALIRGSGVVSPTLPLSPSSPSPSPLISRQTPESVAQRQQSTATSTIHSSRQQFKTRVNINGAKCELASQQAAPNSSSCEGTQIVKVIAGGGGAGQFGERVSRRSSFRNSSLRRRPSFSGSIASIHREPGAPRPGSPVPRSILELAAAAAASSSSNQANASIILPTSSPSSKPSGILSSRQNQLGAKMTTTTSESSHHQAGELEEFGAEQQQQQEQDGHNNSKQQQQHQLQRALILAQKYNYSPAKLATSKLSSKLHLKELIATTGNNYAAEQDDHQSSSERPSGDNSSTQLTAKATLAKGNIKPRNHGPSSQERRLLGLGDSAGKHFDVTGQVQLDISYFARTGSLTVHLLQCSQLEPVNKRRATSNPYVKLYLLPDRTRSGKRKSSVKRHQLNPKFDERFTFGPIQLHEFDSRTLWLSVWHKDRGLSRNEFLGELYLPMSRVRQQLLTSDLCQSISSRWYQLTSPLERSETLRQNERNPPVRQADGTLLTTKKLPLPAANGNGTIARGHTGKDIKTSGLIGASETDAVRKLSEFEKRAARLTQQHHLFAQQNSINPASASESPAADDEPATQQPLVHKSTSLGLMSDTSRHNRVQDEFGIAQGSPSYKTNISQQSIGLVGLNLNLDGPGQTPVKTMQVTLGPMQQQQPSDCSITGQMFVALKFVPESGELLAKRASAQVWGSLHVLIKEARDIGGFKSGSGAVASDQMPSPFCKCLLLDSNGHRMAKHRTNQLRRTNSPRWDQELVFPRLKVANLQAQAIEIQLFNRDSILVSSSEHLGSIRLCKRLKETASANARQEQRVEGEEGGEEMVVSTSTKTATGATTNMPSISSSSASLKSSTSSSASSNPTVDDDLCSEREARLWGQMLARPNIWVYGELPLRQLRPIVPLPITTPGTNSTDTNK